MRIPVLDRPRSGENLMERQDAWDAATRLLAAVTRETLAGSRRKPRGSRRSRRLFEDRVVARARTRQSRQWAEGIREQQRVGEIVFYALTDWVEHARYSTVTVATENPETP